MPRDDIGDPFDQSHPWSAFAKIGKEIRQLCLAMIAGGDSPERAAERLGINLKLVEAMVALDMVSRSIARKRQHDADER